MGIHFGHSFTAGLNASPGTAGYVGLFVPVNRGVSAAQAADMSGIVQQEVVDAGQRYTVFIGLNDLSRYKGDTAKMEFFRRSLRASLAWLSLPSKKTARGAQAGIAFSGAWTDSPSPNPCGKYTTAQGATAAATVEGDTVFIGLSEGDYVAMGEAITVTIDGLPVHSGSVKVPGVTTWLDQWWSRSAWRFSGLGPGPHSVVVTHTSPAGKFLHLDYIAADDQPARPRVLVSNISKCSAAWYAGAGVSEALLRDYNAVIAAVCAEFPNCTLVDNYSGLDPALHVSADGAHPNNAGHAQIYRNFAAAGA
jgi:hypothetical protein